MVEPNSPSHADLASLHPADVRAALLARGIGMSEREVEQALALLLKEDVAARRSAGRGRSALGAEANDLRAGSSLHTSRVALDFAVEWFARTFFVGR